MRHRPSALRGAVLVLAILAIVGNAALPVAAASSVSPEPPPQTGTGPCPSNPLFPGQEGAEGSLVAFFQPGQSAGSTCGLANGGTLVGDVIIFGLYTPNTVPNDTVPIMVEEFKLHTVTVYSPGPNNTTVSRSVTEAYNQVWSNASVAAVAGQIQEDQLTVPAVQGPQNLTISILGATIGVTIVTPGAGIPIPQNYPQLLLHDFGFEFYAALFLIVGIGFAVAIRWRTRHVERVWPFGVVGMIGVIGFAGWFEAQYPLSLIPVATVPEAAVAAPLFFVGAYAWLALFPTEAREYKIRYPVAEVDGQDGMVGQKFFRIYPGPEGDEYIGPGGAGAFWRLLGVRTYFDDRVLTQAPHKRRLKGFRSARRDVYAEYYAYAEFPGGPKILDVRKPRVYVLPWRKRSREAIAEYHRKALRGKVEEPDHVGMFLYVTPSRAFAAVTSRQGAVLVEGWISGTLHVSRIGLALERVLVAYTELKVGLKAQALDWGHKIALALRMAEEYPDSPIALKALEDLAIRHEAAIMDEREWLRFLERKVEEDRTPTDPAGAFGKVERLLDQTVAPTPSPRAADDQVRDWVKKRGAT